MTTNTILSIQSSTKISPQQWLDELLALKKRVNLSTPLFVDLPVSQVHENTLFEDNPPIEELEDLQMKVTNLSLSLLSLSVAINFQNLVNWGEEISRINGWTDMASYLGLNLIRLEIIPQDSTLSTEQQSTLNVILDYMLDMDMQISIICYEEQFNIQNALIQNMTVSDQIGFEYIYHTDQISSIEKDNHNLVKTIRLDLPELSNNDLDTQIAKLTESARIDYLVINRIQ